MLTFTPQSNLRNAREYFENHLVVGDYYSQGQVVPGEWMGVGAERLGLAGIVGKDEFVALCENLHPVTGEQLTPLHKTTRKELDADGKVKETANRRLFYDVTISPPKSVSVAALVKGDERIIESHDRAVRVAMRELECFAATRVRRGGRNEDRDTGELVTAIFRHNTSRAVDPQLHSHCIVFNATYDEVEGRWKALQAEEMHKARKYAENVYYHELARDLRSFGYGIVNKARGDFELEGVPRSLIWTFSKRDRQIDEQTRELLAQAPELAGGNLAEVRAHLAHKLRPQKAEPLSPAELQASWLEQMSGEEKQGLEALGMVREGEPEAVKQAPAITESDALRWAEEHVFDRHTTVVERQLWAYALERGRGESFTLEDLHAATANAPYIHDPLNPEQFSTQPVLDRETGIIQLAQESANACASSLVPDWPGDARLDAAQAEAARRILSVRDSIVLFRGRAGTGKSFTLKTVYDALQAEGHAVQVLAPQRQQVEGLTQDGMAGAETISGFLTRRRMKPGEVVIVDEAGQIGAKDMLALLTFIKERGGRVILSGDTGQHGPVQASDALRAMEKYGHLHIAELNDIRRQDPARGRNKAERQWIATYKQAVQDASEGRLDQSFDLLDEAGAVVECTLADKQQKLAEHYLELVRKKRSALVVSPTWGEIHRVNDAVRQRLRATGLLGKKEWVVSALQADDLTDAQKGDARYYDDGRVIVFNQTCRGIPKGAVGSLVAVTAESIVVEAAGRVRTVPLAQAGHLTVCKKQEMKLSKGDRLQLKANAQTAEGKRFINGELVTVKRVEKNGKIHLDDGRVLPPEYREFVRGYAVTSYASQGKTVDHVLFSDSSIKAATNAEQWYVTISRGRIGVRIFTTDKERLRENVARSGQERLAVEVAAKQVPQVRTGHRVLPCNHPDVIKRNQKGHETAKKWRLRHRELQNQNQNHDPVRTIQTVE